MSTKKTKIIPNINRQNDRRDTEKNEYFIIKYNKCILSRWYPTFKITVYFYKNYKHIIKCRNNVLESKRLERLTDNYSDNMHINYHSNTNIQSIEYFINTFINGASYRYYKNGCLQEYTYFTDGSINSWCLSYNDDGTIKYRRYYINNVDIRNIV